MAEPRYRRKPRRSFALTPLGILLGERRTRWLYPCVVPAGGYPIVRALPEEALLVVVVMSAMLFLCCGWLAWSFPWHASFMSAVKQLYAVLPWFRAGTVSFVHPSRRKELDEALLRERFVIHDIDGASIRSLADLTQALEEQFGALAKPRDPYRRAAALLASAMSKRLEHHAFLWHGEHVIVAHDQQAQDLFLAAWQRLVRKSMPHVLLFLITPDEPVE